MTETENNTNDYSEFCYLLKQHNCSLYITGLSGSGKTTLGNLIAPQLGFPYLDVGIGYRLATLANQQSMDAQISSFDFTYIEDFLWKMKLDHSSGKLKVIDEFDNDLTDQLYRDSINQEVSQVASNLSIRDIVNSFFRRSGIINAVITGRNTIERITNGSIVEVKIHVDIQERARRIAEEKGTSVDEEKLKLLLRDSKDQGSLARISNQTALDLTYVTPEQSALEVVRKGIQLCQNACFQWED